MQHYPVLGDVVQINGQTYVTVKIDDRDLYSEHLNRTYYFMDEMTIKSNLSIQPLETDQCYIVEVRDGTEEQLWKINESKKYEVIPKEAFVARRIK